ncbi:MAG: HAD-IIIA family hydrolase [Bacteroidales bacterium]|nr:HAD-IIIA family hydrolase [Bacteroidales bacterium]
MILKKIISKKRFLFLDRDGVINKRKVDDYISCWDDFEFLPGVLNAMKAFAQQFERIIIVTNQQGIGKNIMSHQDLKEIHQKLKQTVIENHGQIDGIYYCSMLKDAPNNCRKPGNTMALQAQRDFPEINFNESLMVGDTSTDMEFGKNMGMSTILLQNKHTTENDRKHADAFIHQLTEISERKNKLY